MLARTTRRRNPAKQRDRRRLAKRPAVSTIPGMERVRNSTSLDRRQVLGALAGGAAALLAPASIAAAPLTRTIPSSGEALPLVGLGTWITFNVGKDPVARDACTEVMRAFF